MLTGIADGISKQKKLQRNRFNEYIEGEVQEAWQWSMYDGMGINTALTMLELAELI